jgi:hypothetical protein
MRIQCAPHARFLQLLANPALAYSAYWPAFGGAGASDAASNGTDQAAAAVADGVDPNTGLTAVSACTLGFDMYVYISFFIFYYYYFFVVVGGRGVLGRFSVAAKA